LHIALASHGTYYEGHEFIFNLKVMLSSFVLHDIHIKFAGIVWADVLAS